MRFQKLWMILGALALLFAVAPASHAQLNSNTANVNLNAVLGEAITVSANPGTVNFTLVPNGVANGDSAVSVTTTWVLDAARTDVNLYAYFASSAAALTDGAGNDIPSANVGGSVNGGASVPFSASVLTGTGITVFTEALTPATLNSNRTDTIDLTIDTTGLGLPSATYTGTLNIQAQAL
jgi:hypothetical protein